MHDALVANLLRQPRRPHRRERAIVPGARRLAPPEGRLTLCLMNERGKVIHRTEAVNSITTQLRECAATWLRGQDLTGLFGVGGVVPFADWGAGITDNPAQSVGSAYPHIWAHFRQFLHGIYLSSSSAAVDDDWWFPLGLEAGARLDANNTFTDNKKRGNRITANSIRDAASNLYVVDFDLNIANGFSIESVGLAGLRFPGTDTYDGVWGWFTGNALLANGSANLGAVRISSFALTPGSATKVWVMGADGTFELDFALATSSVSSWALSALRSITGPTLATWGSPSATNSGIAIIGTDFWMMDTTRLRRFNIPTSTSLPTLHDTYSPVSGFTDAACLGLVSDGTDLYALGSSKVFVISTSTGAVTSSWTHNVSSAVGLTYDPVHDVLWIIGNGSTGYPQDGFTTQPGPVAYMGDPTHVGGNSGYASPMPFTKAGTALGYGMQPYWVSSSNSGTDCFLLADSGRLLGCLLSNSATNTYSMTQSGGVLGTRALVAAPFTKTAANPLRVEYEVEFLS